MREIKINLTTNQNKQNTIFTTPVIIILAFLIVATSLGITYGLASEELRHQQMINNKLKIKSEEIKAINNGLSQKQELARMLNTKEKLVKELSKEIPILSKAFTEVESAITPDSMLLNLVINYEKIEITGIATNHAEIAYIIANIRESKYFINTKLVSTQVMSHSEKLMFHIETYWEVPIK